MMHNPPHPGESILDLCLEPLNMSITKAAEHLGISRKHLSAVINGRAPVSPDLAIRLAKAFGGSPETWVRM
jgi:addiction module HigA family antidote